MHACIFHGQSKTYTACRRECEMARALPGTLRVTLFSECAAVLEILVFLAEFRRNDSCFTGAADPAASATFWFRFRRDGKYAGWPTMVNQRAKVGDMPLQRRIGFAAKSVPQAGTALKPADDGSAQDGFLKPNLDSVPGARQPRINQFARKDGAFSVWQHK